MNNKNNDDNKTDNKSEVSSSDYVSAGRYRGGPHGLG